MEPQQFLVLKVSQFGSNLLPVIHNQRIGSLYRQKRKLHGNSPILKISVIKASTIFSSASN